MYRVYNLNLQSQCNISVSVDVVYREKTRFTVSEAVGWHGRGDRKEEQQKGCRTHTFHPQCFIGHMFQTWNESCHQDS